MRRSLIMVVSAVLFAGCSAADDGETESPTEALGTETSAMCVSMGRYSITTDCRPYYQLSDLASRTCGKRGGYMSGATYANFCYFDGSINHYQTVVYTCCR